MPADQLLTWLPLNAERLLLVVVLLVLLGLLVPYRSMKERLDREREIGEYFRKAAEASDARADKLADLLADALKHDRARR